ncbi:STAS domain-containing protein [Actinoplanes sp. NEAU-A12]|uniref:Anti-sigma factor antagonist n=1 Tax=Actinoplanes sandaracinus TaxID=3045177 RepID=A0ABT6WSG4_9ACTN|nr:STAS domain-containing protein [Actinoplanes sandaracinus]MDI6102686.1 STAS domain-containing protein [Actinoplanes sandaracinus]
MMDPFLTVTTTIVGERATVLSATGEIDGDSRKILGEAADAAIAAGQHRLVIDLTGVTFCDSGGLSLFVELHRRITALGGELRLAGLREMVATVVRATNLDRLLLLYPTVDEAVEASRHAG